ncbi:MAG: shikimate dehydrogenase [Oscillospiraceae bacterium]|nr:shikimate dehydrogenase [Oscillospiraceae bacterium]
MKKKNYGLVGYPLGHSLSPFIHGEIFKRNNLGHDYSLYEISPAELEKKYELLSLLDGFNVTIPLKELIIPYCESLDDSSSCGAVNCVKEKVGYNTDVYGFKKSIEILGASFKQGSRVCLLGYGGAGKMVAHAVGKAGGKLTVAEIDVSRLKNCPENTKTVQINELKGEFDLLINSTPVGMHPNTDASPIDFERVSAEFVLDIVYNPSETKLLRLAKQKGAKVLNGLTMLVWQAIKSHEIWYGGKADEDGAEEIIKAVEKKLI